MQIYDEILIKETFLLGILYQLHLTAPFLGNFRNNLFS